MDGSQDGDDSLTCMCLARTGDVLCVGRLSGDVAVLNSGACVRVLLRVVLAVTWSCGPSRLLMPCHRAAQ